MITRCYTSNSQEGGNAVKSKEKKRKKKMFIKLKIFDITMYTFIS